MCSSTLFAWLKNLTLIEFKFSRQINGTVPVELSNQEYKISIKYCNCKGNKT